MRASERFFLGVLLPALAGAAFTAPAHAAWPHDPNNGNVAVCTVQFNKLSPNLATDGAGGAIIAWQDLRPGTNYDVYAQRVDASGAVRWAAPGVAVGTGVGDQDSPVVVSDGAGGAIIAWQDARNANFDIFAQRLNAAGVPQWTANGVALCTAGGAQTSPVIVSDGAGGAIVAWVDTRAGNSDVYAQRISAAGAPQWTANGVGVCTLTSTQIDVAITSDGAGGAILAWSDFRNGSNYDLYSQRLGPAGNFLGPTNGAAVCTAAGDQLLPVLASDGANGAIVGWLDSRSGTYDIYAQHVVLGVAPQWAAGGVALCAAAGTQGPMAIASDGSGGAIAAWQDLRSGGNDIYAQRVDAAGTPQWTTDGVPLCTLAGDQLNPQVAADGAGGAFVTWQDQRFGQDDIYAQRVSATGAPEWAASVAVSSAANSQALPQLVPDGAGGAILTWQDLREGTDWAIYAQRIERFGKLGNPEPASAGVRDVPGDQGGNVKVSWFASYLDADPTYEIASYSLWRSSPPNLALQALRAGARLVAADAPLPSGPGRVFTTSVQGTQTIFWELVGSQVADGDAGYSLVAGTTADSSAAGNPTTLFRIQAHDRNGTAFWNSAPDSGYSVDNVPPAAPAPFTGAYVAGATDLHWGANHEADLAGYRLYRGGSAGFVPGPTNLVAAPPDTGYVDGGPAGSYYKLSAVDMHGNESGFALLAPAGTLATGAQPGLALSLAGALPNPATSRRLSVAFVLPASGPAELELLDVGGRCVARRDVGALGAGRHAVDLAAGRTVAPGLYLVRLRFGGEVRSVRVAVLG